MRKAVIFNPYWNTLGGGEKYTATVVKVLSDVGFEITLLWPDPDIISAIHSRFNLDLHNIHIDKNGFNLALSSNLIQRFQYFQRFNLCFWVSDGSLPFLFSRQNLLHFQVPFNQNPSPTYLANLKKLTYNQVICNSQFTKKIIDRTYGVKSQVIYPPATMVMPSNHKQNVILSVGRFDNLLHAKRQDVLIDAFKRLNQPNWQLILCGGSVSGEENIAKLRKQAQGLDIKFVVNPEFSKIQEFYQQAALYWHAAGFGVNVQEDPTKVEHFGITTVEAMSAGAIPIVYGAGGQLEVINSGTNGFIWHSIADLVKITTKLIANSQHRQKLMEAGISASIKYSEEVFTSEFRKIIR